MGLFSTFSCLQVDHGKTTLCDCLIVSNGIISQRLAGKIRYMDSRPDEAQRGITMKSSSISLLYRDPAASETDEPYLINLIDSPGHVDFSAEVSTAVRMTDGALVVVDVVEGVCIQTESVLRQARLEGVTPVLVMNKMDRLVHELLYTPQEAYLHLYRVLTAVNAVCALLWKDEDTGDVSEVDEFFSPAKGNVVFASAVHGWAFGVEDFAKLYATKLGMKEDVLRRTLWGEYYLDAKARTVATKPKTEGAPSMFAQLCLRQVWEGYGACGGPGTGPEAADTERLQKMASGLGLAIPPREWRAADAGARATTLFARWLPLARAVLRLAVAHLPDPRAGQRARVQQLAGPSGGGGPRRAALVAAIEACDPEGPVLAFVGKMFPAQDDLGGLAMAQRRVRDHVGQQHPESQQVFVDEEESCVGEGEFVAFCRIFSGTLREGAPVWVLGPRHDPNNVALGVHAHETTAKQLFLLMGRALERLPQVPAGNVFGARGLSKMVLKTATLATDSNWWPLSAMPSMSHPVVRVAVEPRNPYELPQLMAGLELLNQADPCVSLALTDAGEYLLSCAGEMHLEVCLRDLRERYARVEVEASAPLVPFRETVGAGPGRDPTAARAAKVTSSDRKCTVTVEARPLPVRVAAFLARHAGRVAGLREGGGGAEEEDTVLRQGLERELGAAGPRWRGLLTNLWALSAHGSLLINRVPGWGADPEAAWHDRKPLRGWAWSEATRAAAARLGEWEEAEGGGAAAAAKADPAQDAVRESVDASLQSGFLMACEHGPLAEEPIMGVCFVVTGLECQSEGDAGATGDGEEASHGPLSGQMVTSMVQACRAAFLARAARLYEATYVCDVRLTERSLGKVSQVLGRRRANIYAQDYDADTSTLSLKALLPVRESFGLHQEILSETSGAASVQLVLGDWQLLDVDPFFVARSEEELEDIGHNVNAMGNNLARELVDETRRRKGLQVEEKLVIADKQRTHSKKK